MHICVESAHRVVVFNGDASSALATFCIGKGIKGADEGSFVNDAGVDAAGEGSKEDCGGKGNHFGGLSFISDKLW
jgi:hypothetical protein